MPSAHSASRAPSTHYPSWGSGTPPVSGAVAPTSVSLPLMGIGNPSLPYRHERVSSTHYPSWGSGTRAAVDPNSRSYSHYPSWGSGTTLRPHHPPSVAAPHYPSWGSGTCGGLVAVGHQPVLTTPHGDREPRTRVGIGRTSAGSLPLMGIGNDDLAGEEQLLTELTTPHGDREPLALGAMHGVFRPSLPLMGIGNAKGARGRRAVRDSLPLMGIGNMQLEPAIGNCAHLTTPHGDRERVDNTSHALVNDTHYPSWGSGTLVF